jgi:hypothetical protein
MTAGSTVVLVLMSLAWPALAADRQNLEAVRRRVVTQGAVCADPDRPCEGFKPNELSFKIANAFDFDRGRDRSLPFYAVLLKTAPRCSISEPERLEVQALFPRDKVFVNRYFCEDFADKVTYTNANDRLAFIGVYAGATEAAAKALLGRVNATGRFPGANIRRMSVVVAYQIE